LFNLNPFSSAGQLLRTNVYRRGFGSKISTNVPSELFGETESKWLNPQVDDDKSPMIEKPRST
jgi:hypothetical protein